MRRQPSKLRIQKTNRPCVFCTNKTEPSFREVGLLEKLVSDRGKILGRKRTGVCAKHQRRLTRAIKQARFIALLPFVERVA